MRKSQPTRCSLSVSAPIVDTKIAKQTPMADLHRGSGDRSRRSASPVKASVADALAFMLMPSKVKSVSRGMLYNQPASTAKPETSVTVPHTAAVLSYLANEWGGSFISAPKTGYQRQIHETHALVSPGSRTFSDVARL